MTCFFKFDWIYWFERLLQVFCIMVTHLWSVDGKFDSICLRIFSLSCWLWFSSSDTSVSASGVRRPSATGGVRPPPAVAVMWPSEKVTFCDRNGDPFTGGVPLTDFLDLSVIFGLVWLCSGGGGAVYFAGASTLRQEAYFSFLSYDNEGERRWG